MKEQVLVVDDEEDIVELLRYNLTKNGYRVSAVGSGEEGLAAARQTPPDLLLLDLMLPGVDGLDVCRELKGDSKTKAIPIIMLSAKGEEADIVAGLELGADDYLTKPFSPRVLLARIKSVLRRGRTAVPDAAAPLRLEELLIDPLRHEATVAGTLIDLTRTEFRILHFLARQPGWVFTRAQIVDAVHGEDYPVTDRSVDVQIVGLRRKLGGLGRYIDTVRGVGYRFKG
jgi:two-component system, OmpR family, alkaline phosphatase synthesis response regulator PhoP